MNLARAREFIDQIVRFYLAIQQRATDSCIIAAFSNLQKDEKKYDRLGAYCLLQ